MKLDKLGYKIITQFEGLSLKPYLCSARIPTIGYGNTYYPNGKRVTLVDEPITEVEAFEMFKTIADKFAKRVSGLLTKEVTQNQFNSLVSLSYNIGINAFATSTLLKKVNANPKDITISNEFKRWNKAGGVVVQGLVNRRLSEVENYNK